MGEFASYTFQMWGNRKIAVRGLALGSVCPKHSFPTRNFSHIYNNEIVNNEKKVSKKKKFLNTRANIFKS